VRAFDVHGREKWKAYTGASVVFPPAFWKGRLFVGSADGRVYAFEAATGRRLWSYRVAPAERRICVYGNLISTWPVAGGVVVEDGVVYAAAGIAHYDGTHVIALDAITGKPKWYNDASGLLSTTAHSGVSLQGNLRIDKGELRFTGGGVYETARFELTSGKCLNKPHHGIGSQYHTAFYPYYPEYGKYISLDHTRADGTTLVYDVTYEGSGHGKLALLSALKPGQSRPKKPVSRWGFRRRGAARTSAVWTARGNGRFAGFIVGSELLVAAGQITTEGRRGPFVTAFRLKDGQRVWTKELTAEPVRGGTAIDHTGQVYVSTVDGSLACFAPSKP
jgi:outer membrane protein assembly factor BamB